jgi:pyruvate,water dikinase
MAGQVQLSTGLKGFDTVVNGIIAGDNIVWQVDSVSDYLPFVRPYCRFAKEGEIPLVYFRFAKHPPLVGPSSGAEIHELEPENGFEAFISEIHDVVARHGKGGYYLFDSLSDLAVDWYSDRMLGNFFMLTCPYLYQMETIAFFAILRNHHSFHAISTIVETTQLFLDIYHHKGRNYVHPIKVQGRYSPTLNMLHVWQNDDSFVPVTESVTITEILADKPWSRLDSASLMNDYWARAFSRSELVQADFERGRASKAELDDRVHRVLRMIITRDERMLKLAEQYLTLKDILNVWRRMIGTGLIGGKSVGLLLGRAILEHANERWKVLLEAHDSFYIGADVFYTFLVQNKIWWIRQKQRDPAHFLEGAEEARQRMLEGIFPDYITKQFGDLLDYFGQSPIIIRSSSLLEDAFGNAFAGKYESIFCANQGPRAKRLDDFMSAVRRIYASSMSEKALVYRSQRGLLDKDEQMALLVQRVSGAPYGKNFFPQAAGVGFSFNPYVWSEYIEPEAGMLRLVFGLGTRAVDRSDDDYTRIVALNAPDRRPEENQIESRQLAQQRVDLLDLELNQLFSKTFEEVAKNCVNLPLEMFASRDSALERRAADRGITDVFSLKLTFDTLLTKTAFAADMRDMLAILEKAYDCPVDVEFTVNFFGRGNYKVNLVQCRPLQLRGGGTIRSVWPDIEQKNVIIRSVGPVIGQSRAVKVDRLIYVVPAIYGHLADGDRYAIARLIGQIAHSPGADGRTMMLLGPGRWGTSTPSLGIPVSFAEINTVSILCEIVAMRDDFVPDVSLGTHFFSDLIEFEILYIGLFPTRENNVLNKRFFSELPNRVIELVPGAAKWAEAVRVIDGADMPEGKVMRLYANTFNQKVVCYLDKDAPVRGK